MRNLLLTAVTAILLFSCRTDKNHKCDCPTDSLQVARHCDSVVTFAGEDQEYWRRYTDSIQKLKVVRDTIARPTDKRKIDSLATALHLANYKVEKVKFYLRLVDQKASNGVFLKGWVKRAVQ
ncbi:MAG: putative peptidoglycan-binding domain-containing protein [Ferruginibacter sp.]